jgi:hypothetical protein
MPSAIFFARDTYVVVDAEFADTVKRLRDTDSFEIFTSGNKQVAVNPATVIFIEER